MTNALWVVFPPRKPDVWLFRLDSNPQSYLLNSLCYLLDCDGEKECQPGQESENKQTRRKREHLCRHFLLKNIILAVF